jgi:MFS transporter, SP family, sugar:H+ symporter
MPDFQARFGEIDSNGNAFLSPSRQSIITSLLSAGYALSIYLQIFPCLYALSTFVGALAQAFTSDSMGRRGSILIWSAIFTVGTAIQTGTSTSLAQITIGRFIAGLGVGALSGMY